MGDVKVEIEEYTAFPTMVYKFSPNLSADMHSEMSAYIRARNKLQTEDNIQIMSIFHPLAETVQHTMVNILNKLEYQYQKIEITSMWGNVLKSGDPHPPHTHSNNLWSGVYYISVGEDASPICFFDPRPSANYLQPKNNPNWNNSSMLKFSAHVGTGLIFPSWLMHWVPPTPSERMSVSWNILLRGDYGMGQFQNASI